MSYNEHITLSRVRELLGMMKPDPNGSGKWMMSPEDRAQCIFALRDYLIKEKIDNLNE